MCVLVSICSVCLCQGTYLTENCFYSCCVLWSLSECWILGIRVLTHYLLDFRNGSHLWNILSTCCIYTSPCLPTVSGLYIPGTPTKLCLGKSIFVWSEFDISCTAFWCQRSSSELRKVKKVHNMKNDSQYVDLCLRKVKGEDVSHQRDVSIT